uniref:Uncharacterized protein n=1 Tax=Setaria viridis TaxID=4556 RepID=A0A4V6D9X6_SETVI|nr:hypothetical protein SEVIR_3G268532v2 [Setaria viridis]
MTQQVDTYFEDVVVVEDASEDEEIVSGMGITIESPIFLITVEDDPTHSTADRGSTIIVSSPDTTSINGEYLGCPPIHPPSPPSMATRRQCKSYDRSSLRRSAHLAQCNVLEDLGILENDGNLNEDAIQEYANRLKDLLPLDHLKPLKGLKSRAFLDLLVEVSCFL